MVAVVRCADGPCLNAGECGDLPRGFTCDCYYNFTGSICETGRTRSRALPIYILTHTDLHAHFHRSTYSRKPIYILTYTDLHTHVHLSTYSRTPIYMLTSTDLHTHVNRSTYSRTPIYMLMYTDLFADIHRSIYSHSPICMHCSDRYVISVIQKLRAAHLRRTSLKIYNIL